MEDVFVDCPFCDAGNEIRGYDAKEWDNQKFHCKTCGKEFWLEVEYTAIKPEPGYE